MIMMPREPQDEFSPYINRIKAAVMYRGSADHEDVRSILKELIETSKNVNSNRGQTGHLQTANVNSDKCINAGKQPCDCNSDWLDDLLNSFMEYTYSYAKGDIPMTENPPLLLARKTQQAIKEHIAKERAQAVEPYYELIMAVGNKFEGETRHQTALRYIKQAEESNNEPAEAALNQQKPTLADIASKQPSEAATAAIRQAADDSVKLQQEVIDYLKDPKNIAKAAEGSMDKRNEVNKTAIYVDKCRGYVNKELCCSGCYADNLPPMMCGGCNLEFPGYKEIKEHMDSEHSEEADKDANDRCYCDNCGDSPFHCTCAVCYGESQDNQQKGKL